MKGLAHEHFFAYPNFFIIHHKGAMLMSQCSDITNLRLYAEQMSNKHQEQQLNQAYPDIVKMTADEIQALVYELQVHQIELVMQNEELINTQQVLRKSQQDYTRIYDFAPIAYLTLSQQGVVQQANKAAIALFDQSHEKLLNQRLEKLIHADDQDAYYLFFRKLLKEQSNSHLIVRIPLTHHYKQLQLCHSRKLSM